MSINWPVWLAAMMYAVWENKYFGWNWYPKSDAEMIADGLFFVMLALSMVSVRGKS